MPPRTSVAATVAAVLLTAGCSTPEHEAHHPPATSPTPATGSPAPSPGDSDWLADLPGSAELSEPVVARGRVTRADGSTVADAQVTLVVWPEQQVLDTLEEGDPVPLAPVAKARTGSDGGYELRIAAELRTGLMTDADGIIDYEVSAETPEGMASFSWSGPPELTHPQTVDLELVEIPR